MSVAEKLKGKSVQLPNGPLWQGPEGEGPQGGVTQSMISSWLQCRERFRVKVIEGWKAVDSFNKYLEYGNMWHVCEEALAKAPGDLHPKKSHELWLWEVELKAYCITLAEKYPTQIEDVDHWYRTCKTQFPYYVEYWRKQKDVVQRTPLMQEQVFDVPYELPSGRTVRLRGKFDSVDLIGKGKDAGIYLQENKTKGDVDRVEIERMLKFDLQTQLYLVALTYTDIAALENPEVAKVVELNKGAANLIKGVRYNVVRRPFSGGRGSIKHNLVKETKDQFYKRLADDYFAVEPEYWFARWKCEVHQTDVSRFRKDCLDPILEAMCWWYDGQTGMPQYRDSHIEQYDPPNFHWRHPFGVTNSVDEGYKTDFDNFIENGSTVGLVRNENLFPELT